MWPVVEVYWDKFLVRAIIIARTVCSSGRDACVYSLEGICSTMMVMMLERLTSVSLMESSCT